MKIFVKYEDKIQEFPSNKKFCEWAESQGLFYTKAGFSHIRGNTSSVSFVQENGQKIVIRKNPFSQ